MPLAPMQGPLALLLHLVPAAAGPYMVSRSSNC